MCDRLDRLEELNFFEELVVASAQLVEQIIKRYLIREVNRQRVGWDIRNRVMVDIQTVRDRDNLVQRWVEPRDLSAVWLRLLHDERRLPKLDEALDSVAGPQAWNILVARRGPLRLVGMGAGDRPLRFGLRQCRHQLIHGKHAPPTRELEMLGPWGAGTVKAILNPDSGWPRLLDWNAQQRLPPLRARHGGTLG